MASVQEDIFTTGEVAKVFGCAPRTATKLMDRGDLPSFRLPGSLDRRTTAGALLGYIFAQPEAAREILRQRLDYVRSLRAARAEQSDVRRAARARAFNEAQAAKRKGDAA